MIGDSLFFVNKENPEIHWYKETFFPKNNPRIRQKRGAFMVKKGEMLSVFSIGAIGYSLLEILWRGNTHWTMTLAGGICFSGIHLANIYADTLSVWKKCFLGSALITIVELFTGIAVNLWMRWHVWDYSSQWMNFLGQVCPLFSFLWFLLTFPLLFFYKKIHRFLRTYHLDLKLR